MPTFREDLHTGHSVPLVETDDITKGAVTTGKLADFAVTAPKIADGAVTLDKLGADTINRINGLVSNLSTLVNEDISAIRTQIKEIYTMIRNLSETGTLISQYFGDDQYVGISQKTLTETLREMMARINEIAGDATGVTMEVTPGFFWNDEATLHVTAATDAIFDYIDIYVNDEKVGTAADVATFEMEHVVSETCTVRAAGSVMGVAFEREQTVTKSDGELTIGAGQSWADVLAADPERRTYDLDHPNLASVTVANNGDKIFVALDTYANVHLRRITMNGFEVPMEDPVTEGDRLVYESSNTYVHGTYNIVID